MPGLTASFSAMTLYLNEDATTYTDGDNHPYDLVTDTSALSALQIAAEEAVAAIALVAGNGGGSSTGNGGGSSSTGNGGGSST